MLVWHISLGDIKNEEITIETMKVKYIQPEISIFKVCGKEFLMDEIGVAPASQAGVIQDGKWEDGGVKERDMDFEEKEITYGNIW